MSIFPLSTRKSIVSNENDEINKGSFYEAFVAQELFAHDLIPYYYKSTKIGEIDFIVELEDSIYAIDVKSGKDYKKHKSFDNLISEEKGNDNIRYIVFSNYNVENDAQITYYPIYMIDFLKKPIDENAYVPINIGIL